MKLKSIHGLILLAFAAGRLLGDPLPPPAQSTATNALSLDWVISEVLSNNPSLKAARANWDAMKERIPQASAWEDPRAGVDTKVARFVSVPPNAFTDQKLTVEQTLPLSGRNRLRGKAASAEAAGAFETFHRRELDLVARTRAAYYRLANANVQLELNRKNAALLKEMVQVSRSKYEVGTHSQSDVLRAETELAKLEEAAFDFQREISDAQTQLNTLMNRSPLSPLEPPAKPDFQPVNLSFEEIAALALAHRPELFLAEQKIAAAQARLDAARKEWIPDPSFHVEGDHYNGASQAVSEVSAGFSIRLPWFNRGKYRAAIREEEKLLESAQQELVAIRLETLGAVQTQLKQVETFHHHTELFKSKLAPLAEQTVTAQRLGYETDKASFLDLLIAQQTLQEVESMYWDHLAHYQMAVAELEALVGSPLKPENSTPESQRNSK